MSCPDCKNEFIGCVCLSEESEANFFVNLYWQKHYRDNFDRCRLCLNSGAISTILRTDQQGSHGYKSYCICPEGMKRRASDMSKKPEKIDTLPEHAQAIDISCITFPVNGTYYFEDDRGNKWHEDIKDGKPINLEKFEFHGNKITYFSLVC